MRQTDEVTIKTGKAAQLHAGMRRCNFPLKGRTVEETMRPDLPSETEQKNPPDARRTEFPENPRPERGPDHQIDDQPNKAMQHEVWCPVRRGPARHRPG